MKNLNIFLAIFLTGALAYTGASRVLQVDSFVSSDATKTWSLPPIATQITGVSDTATLYNKTLSAPTFTGTADTTAAAFAQPTILGGTVSGSTIYANDDNFIVRDNLDLTKRFAFDASGITAGQIRVVTIADANISIGKVPTVQVFNSGTAATYTTPSGVRYIVVEMIGGGGSGAGSGGSTSGSSGNAGNNTTFSMTGVSLTAGGGSGADYVNRRGGAGGTNTISGGTTLIDMPGGRGGGAGTQPTSAYAPGGQGGSGAFGGAGGAGPGGDVGLAGSTNSGGGGGGGGTNNANPNVNAGPGGGSGGYLKVMISSPAATGTYTVGGASTGGTGGTGGFAGGNGAAGKIIITEYYQ